MVADVELAMSIVQLTGVLIPLLLGIARYYVNEQNDIRVEASDKEVVIFTSLLFMLLIFAYFNAFMMVFEYGNHRLTSAVVAYGGFLALLYAAIPYTLKQRLEAYVFGVIGIILFLISYYLILLS